MLVTVHGYEGKQLVLHVQGASREAVVDAFWIGLKSPHIGKPLVIGTCKTVVRRDGSLLLHCEANSDVSEGDILYELRFQLRQNSLRASA